MRPGLLAALNAARAERQMPVVATRLEEGEGGADSGEQRLFVDPAADAADPLERAAHDSVRLGRSQTVQHDGCDWFLHVHAPAPRLIVVGAVHIAQSLVPMARLLQFDTVVCDPRARYATEERFPGTRLRGEWPDAAVRAERPDRFSAVVVLSHDPKLDDPALAAALDSPCGYVGALGSRRSQAARLERLAGMGVPQAALARVLGPVGLDLGAVGAGEIAVSILAEWIAQRRGAAVRPR